MPKEPKHSMQPVVLVKDVVRFQVNPIVQYLLEHGGIDMNKLSELRNSQGFTDEDYSHFAQLIGYSLSGWSDLSYVTEEEWRQAYQKNYERSKRPA